MRGYLTVKKLRDLLEGLPDDAPVIQSASDHSYRRVTFTPHTALYDAATDAWTEDYGEDETPEEEYGKRIEVVIVR